jgi:Domain of unknown function (DUF4124)
MKIATILSGSVLLTAILPGVWAAQVYTWTDADGITHFSETPPADEQLEHTVREIEPAPVTGTPADDDYYSVANQAARMEARRLERERIRAEILKAEAEARRADADAEAAAREQATEHARDHSTGYLPLYPYYPYHGYRHYPSPRFTPRKPHRPSHNKRLVVTPEQP